ncbi:hypothetical protein BD779DRAFT_1486610 [Infundibulicybe gibba]|nr:hypothetical protein BD779DRAFT_1486610 [Infundibulicybe gibba]
MSPANGPNQQLSMDLPVIDLDLFISKPRDSESVRQECEKAANALIVYGALLLRDSRVSEQDNSMFLDLLEDYFNQPPELLKEDERPELSYQVGVTLENTEKPKCAMGEQPPYQTQYPGLNAPNVVPRAEALKKRWPEIMGKWGSSMKNAVADLAEMAAVGLGLPAQTFREAGKYGPHILAPTASDLVKYGRKDTILAGFHSDLNFLTIHGRSRYPGLHIWARNTGKRIPVKIPDGNYLLVQAGKQLEHMTGGLIKAGFHEVVVNEKTLEVIEKRKAQFPHRPLIRISSTFFWHLSSDYDLAPIPMLAEHSRVINLGERDNTVYEPMKAGQQVQNELKHIALMV